MRVVTLVFVLLGCVHALNVDISLDSLTLDPRSPGSELILSFTAKNNYQNPVTLLKWNTPLDDASVVLKGKFLKIEKDQEKALYTGIMAKRYPTPEDFVLLQPGESVSASIDILKGYAFVSAGVWNVSLESYLHWNVGYSQDLDTLTPELVNSRILSVSVTRPSKLPDFVDPKNTSLLGAVTIVSCGTSETTQIKNADTSARSLTVTGQNQVCSTSSYYKTWFGACDSSVNGRDSTVKKNEAAIASGLNGNYRVDCAGKDCSANTYAYVFPNDANRNVYVCGAFWSTGTSCKFDSQAGTLIHEMSHFSGVAGTQDITYGTASCKTLATNKPADAIKNADNYEYFNENGC